MSGEDIGLSLTKAQRDNNVDYFKSTEIISKKIYDKPQNTVYWNSIEAKEFRKVFSVQPGEIGLPRQKEHMLEDAIFSELEEMESANKPLYGILPIQFSKNTRIHMKTALSASQAIKVIPEYSNTGGDIDIFCRRKRGSEVRLTVIELKDENKKAETFNKAIYQAIAYAVFIHELIRSNCGEQWMELWGMKNQKWQEKFTINAVAAMPKGENDDLSFAGQKILLDNDVIELHYIAITDKQSCKFTSSL